MNSPTTEQPETDVVRMLTRRQRRVIGVLLEKAFTTPDQYPLTPKSVTSGCNQKSNRDPVTDYSEDDVLDTLDELRELGLVLEVHTESGRTSRFRHQMRHHYTFSEPQLAILTELLLRGRQSLGELRSRASRMVTIDDLGSLRSELASLIEQGFVRAGGPLERRGVEVDHAFHPQGERVDAFDSVPDTTAASATSSAAPSPAAAPVATPAVPPPGLAVVEQAVERLRQENGELREEVAELRRSFEEIQRGFDDLRRDLGG